ncbi:MAG: hypothetical protein IH623_11625 [Verrucomicrobia bacterium]|nr:hypothetical protein [Verrucomicrobiota bacterium]
MDATQHNQPDADDEMDAPPKLVGALKRITPQPVFVPPSVDAAVLNAARKHLARPQSKDRHAWRQWFLWPAVASACVMLALLAHTLLKPARPDFAREDLNRDGHVDILDAFYLARELHVGTPPHTTLDLNGDGVVDRRDAEVIAALAVKLEKGGPS